jgi:Tfp pilus assembly protein PilF
LELDRIKKDLSTRYYEQGMEYFSRSEMSKAREMFRKSLSYEPDKTESLRALERIKE